jgi:SNF2 family DNA or RNA helicase
MWMKVHFDDSQEWWFCPTSLEFSKSDPAEQDSENAEGSILAEEMGLGKTVEILSLILLSQEPERNLLPVYDSKRLAADVQPSGLTLLVCPQAIIGQWADEITRHAPSLRVLRYSGMKSTYPKEDGREIERTIKRFDIVLCDFDTMAADLTIAKKPHLHHTRAQVARGGRVAYRRSVLIGIEWLRVILDEAR